MQKKMRAVVVDRGFVVDHWYKWHGKHGPRNYTEVKEEITAKLSAQLEPDDVIDEEAVIFFSFVFLGGDFFFEKIVVVEVFEGLFWAPALSHSQI